MLLRGGVEWGCSGGVVEWGLQWSVGCSGVRDVCVCVCVCVGIFDCDRVQTFRRQVSASVKVKVVNLQ